MVWRGPLWYCGWPVCAGGQANGWVRGRGVRDGDEDGWVWQCSMRDGRTCGLRTRTGAGGRDVTDGRAGG